MKPIYKIIETMESKSLKYSDLAAFLGVSKSVVSAWKQRETNPPLEYIVQICRFLDISLFDLLGVENDNISEIELLYSKATPEDKSVIDLILSKYKDNQEQTSLNTKIG